jgi:hypothetical protein
MQGSEIGLQIPDVIAAVVIPDRVEVLAFLGAEGRATQ